MDGKKVDLKYDSPYEYIFVELCQKTKGFFRKLNFTPNMITALSLLSSILMYKAFRKGKYHQAGLLILASYYFDCLDGIFARTYNMTSKFGDFFDHASDIITIVLMTLAVYKSNATNQSKCSYYTIMGVLLFLSSAQTGCIQKMVKNKDDSPTLEILSKISPNESYINYIKYFGPATFYFANFLIFSNFRSVK